MPRNRALLIVPDRFATILRRGIRVDRSFQISPALADLSALLHVSKDAAFRVPLCGRRPSALLTSNGLPTASVFTIANTLAVVNGGRAASITVTDAPNFSLDAISPCGSLDPNSSPESEAAAAQTTAPSPENHCRL